MVQELVWYLQEQSEAAVFRFVRTIANFPNELKIHTNGLIRAYYESAYQVQLLPSWKSTQPEWCDIAYHDQPRSIFQTAFNVTGRTMINYFPV